MDNQGKMYVWINLLAFYHTLSEFAEHRHLPIQITIALGQPFMASVNGEIWQEHHLLLTKPNVPHALSLPESHAVMILVFPESVAGQKLLNKILKKEDSVSLNADLIQPLLPKIQRWGSEYTPPKTVKSDVQAVLDTLLNENYSLEIDRTIDTRIMQALELMKGLPVKRISIDEAAKHVYLSPGRFRHLFKKETGMRFSNYLLQLRVLEALKLAGSGKKISEIAYETGFSDHAHMTKALAKYSGTTPSTLLNAHYAFDVYIQD